MRVSFARIDEITNHARDVSVLLRTSRIEKMKPEINYGRGTRPDLIALKQLQVGRDTRVNSRRDQIGSLNGRVNY